MVALTAQEKQVVDLFRKLSPGRRRRVLLEMARTDASGWMKHQDYGQQQLRRLARARGKDWDSMNDDQRQDFVVDLLKEGRD